MENRSDSHESQKSLDQCSINSKRCSDCKPIILKTYLGAQEHLPFMNDSTATTLKFDYLNNDFYSLSSNYSSHSSQISYTKQ